MLERYTAVARQVVVEAQLSARDFRHDDVGTEHLLMGLLRGGGQPVIAALESLGATEVAVRTAIVELVGVGTPPTTGQIRFTPTVKKALTLASREAERRGCQHVEARDVAVAMLDIDEGGAHAILLRLDVPVNQARAQLKNLPQATSGEPTLPTEMTQRRSGVATSGNVSRATPEEALELDRHARHTTSIISG